jgi:Kef-type K+ transport system membrane component KefB
MTRLPDRKLLSYLAAYDPHVSNLTLAVREMVLEEAPDAIESISKGYAVVIGFSEALDAIGKVSFAFFIPVYFAIVGLKLDLVRGLSLWMIGTFILGSCLVKIFSVSLAGRLAGFRGLDLINLAITTNARGGPGIVLASVAFDAGIISPKFYTTLVIAAVLTSQVAGAWLDYVLGKGWPLLTPLVHRDSTIGAITESPLAP